MINFGGTQKISNGSNNFTDSALPLLGSLPSADPWDSRITLSGRYHADIRRISNGPRFHSILSCPFGHLSDSLNDGFLTLLDWEKVWQKGGGTQNIPSDPVTE